MKKRMLCLALLLTLALCLGVALAETESVKVTGQFGQTEAREMLELINDFRTGDEAWYWDKDDATRITCAGLQPLVYDYELERVAMQRAIETALYWDHTRPNGASCFTAYPDGYMSRGENIAAGQRSTEEAFTSWREDEETYAYQGHRRNMLNSGFNRIGIGHVVFNGCHYWTQELGKTSTTSSATEACDADKQMTVEVDLDYVKSVSLSDAPEVLKVVYDGRTDLPAGVKAQLAETWPSRSFTIDDVPAWTVADTSVADIGDDGLLGKQVGTTAMSATVLGQPLSVDIEVTPADLSGAKVAVTGDAFVYTGSAFTPEAAVTLDGKALASGTDYTIAYQDNTDAGTAKVTATGMNNYQGTATAEFTIAPASLADATLGQPEDVTYKGAAWEPTPSVVWQAAALEKDVDYTLAYADNVNAGKAKVTATGIGNFAGTLEAGFEIKPADLKDLALPDIMTVVTYTGAAQTPALGLPLGVALVEGTDYTAEWKDNVNVGKASVTLTGMGNFTGTAALQFEIVAADISGAGIADIPAQDYTGAAIEPALTVKLGEKALTAGTDYTVSYANNTDAGTATATITGKGNYSGTASKSFVINAPASEAPTTPSDPGTTPADPGTTPTDPGTPAEQPTGPVPGSRTVDDGKYTINPDGTARYDKPAKSAATVTIPDTIDVDGFSVPVTSIADKAFYKNKKLKTVTIGKNVKTIGKSAFASCAKLKTVKGGAGIVTIKASAFKSCKKLTAITLNKKVKTIGKNAFYGCKALKTVTIKTTKLTSKTVGANAFKGIASKATFKCPSKKLKDYKKLLKKKGAPWKAKYKK